MKWLFLGFGLVAGFAAGAAVTRALAQDKVNTSIDDGVDYLFGGNSRLGKQIADGLKSIAGTGGTN